MAEAARVWVEDRRWVLGGAGKLCRMKGCHRPAVAQLWRWSYARDWAYLWAYCENDLYGRRIRNGRVEIRVAAVSPSAERGYVE